MVVVAGMGKLRHGGIVLLERVFSGAVGAEPRAKRVQTLLDHSYGAEGPNPQWG